MSRTKTLYLLLITVAVLVMSIAYTAITNLEFNITGNASAAPSADNFKVAFGKVGTVNAPSFVVGAGTSAGVNVAFTTPLDTAATLDVTGLKRVGDSVVATFTVINESTDLDATLTELNTTGTNNYFTVTAKSTDKVIKAREKTNIEVTVTLIKLPITSNAVANISVNFSAVPTELANVNGGTGGEGGSGGNTKEIINVTVGQTVKYDSNKDGVKEDWIVLTAREGLVEIVSAKPMGSLTLGSSDITVKVTTDLDGDGTIGDEGDIAIASYNNAITTINNYCKSLVTAIDNEGVRSVGGINNNYKAYGSTDYDNWGKKITVAVASEDTKYRTDFDKMEQLGITKCDEDYWFASRFVSEPSNYVYFSVKCVDTSGALNHNYMWDVNADGNVRSNDANYAVRPVIINPSGI